MSEPEPLTQRTPEDEKSAAETLRAKLTEIEEIYPFDPVIHETDTKYTEAVTAELKPQQARVLRLGSVDLGGDQPVGSSKPAAMRDQGSFPPGSDQVMLAGTEPYTGNVLVTVKARVKPAGEPVKEWSEEPKIGIRHTYRVYDAEPADQEIISQYRVTQEDAERVWEYCPWWMMDYNGLERASDVAHQIEEAGRAWEQEFPGVEIGDRQAAFASLGVAINDPNLTSWLGQGDWVERCHWQVPKFMLRDFGELLKERYDKLLELADQGDERAQELLKPEILEQLLNDLWATRPTVPGQEWAETDSGWATYPQSTEIQTEQLPGYMAVIKQEEEEKPFVVGYLDIIGEPGKEYYRMSFDKLEIPERYQRGAAEWVEIEDQEEENG